MRTLSTASALLLTMSLVRAQADPIGKAGAALVSKSAKSVCTINVVLELNIMGQTREHRLAGRGTIAHESGLILTGIQMVEPNVNVRGRNGQVADVKIVPLEFKVVLGNDEKEHEAFLVGKDSKLGFAFIQLKDGLPAKHKSHVVNFSKAKSPKVGEETLSINRLAKGFDYAPFFSVSRILGKMKKPRKAWIHGGSFTTGLPVWNTSGELIGCYARIASGLGKAKSGSGQLVVLRGGLVGSAVKQAVTQAKELAEKAKSETPEAPDKDADKDAGK